MKTSHKDNILNYLFCFFTGFVILSIEMILLKLVVPYSGEDIFSTSIIINSLLLALAIGYWLGGKFRNWRPSLLGIFASAYLAVSILLYPSLGRAMMNARTPYITTIIIVFLLFFVPTILLGTITPLLAEKFKKMGTGKAAGFVYAVGTAGSIAGGLLTGLFLMTNLGIKETLILCTAVLLIFSTLLDFNFLKKKFVAISLGIIILILLLANILISHTCDYEKYGKCLYKAETPYGSYVVIEKDNVKYVMQDRQIQSVSINPATNKTNFYYDDFARFDFDSDDSVLILGNSVGTAMTLISIKNPDTFVTGVEIDPEMTKIGTKWFGLELNEKKKVAHKDARVFLHENEQKYNYIFLDLYHGLEVPDHTLTVEFFEEVKQDLADNGILMINIPPEANKECKECKEYRNIYFDTVSSVFDFCEYEQTTKCLVCYSDNNGKSYIKHDDEKVFLDNFPVSSKLTAIAYYSAREDYFNKQ